MIGVQEETNIHSANFEQLERDLGEAKRAPTHRPSQGGAEALHGTRLSNAAP